MRLLRSPFFFLASIVLVGVLAAQPALHLKSRELAQSDAQPASASASTASAVQPKRRHPGQMHRIVQFPTSPEPGQLDDLRSRGARILSYLPDFAFWVLVQDDVGFDGLGLYWTGTLQSQEKISPIVSQIASVTQDPSGAQVVLVEFHPDVDMSDARAIVLDTQMQIQENPDLLDHHLLISGNSDQIAGLAQWDEVAYIFPASDDLIQGLPVHACAGALTSEGKIGQSILRVGDGWGGPGKNRADLNYAFFNKTPKLPPDSIRSEIVRAFSEWAKYAKLTFTPVDDPAASRTLAVLFGSHAHGDAYPFDGPGGILAHTYYPFPANPEPIAGDLHFDADENWNIGADVDLFSVALHETGHALGLGHSDKPGSVMYPYYTRHTALTDEDISALLSIYAAQDRTPTADPSPLALAIDQPNISSDPSVTLHGTASGGSGDIQITWTSDKGFSGVAKGGNDWTAGPIPLSIGANAITVVATDARNSQAVRNINVQRQSSPGAPANSGPQLNITSPTASAAFSTNTNTVALSGLASGGSGIARVGWANSRGSSGVAAGTTSWNTGAIALQSGANTITITAYAQNGATAVRTLEVSYSPGPANATSPPSLAIVSPALTTVSTSASSISLTGTARDIGGITTVTWTNSTGSSGTATGIENWTISGVPLLVGTNTITVRVTYIAGLAAWRSIVVTRH